MSKTVHTSGKRKTAIARGTVKEGTGRVKVNRKPVELYEPELARLKLFEPLELAGDDLVNSVHGFFPLRAFCPCLPYRQISVFEKKFVFVKFLFHIEFSFRNHYWFIRKK